MLIKESQVKAIIEEEIQKMIEEGEIDEGWFSDKVAGLGRKAVGGMAKMTGLTSSELANQEKAAAAAKTAGEEKASAKQKEAAKRMVVQKVSSLRNLISKIETEEMDKLYDAAYVLGYSGDKTAGGMHINLDPIRKGLNDLAKRLETVLKDVETGKLAEE